MDRKRGGWLVFAAVTLEIAGLMRIFDAIWAFNYRGPLPGNLNWALFGHSLATYGWIYVVEAIVLILCSIGVLAGWQISHWIGIAAGVLACISAIWWMPLFPIWSVVYLALGILVVYALVAHGDEPIPL